MSGRRIAMVTPYPPGRDGIATYAVQEVQQLRAAGHDVVVFSPEPSAAHRHLALGHAIGWGRLATEVNGFDEVIIQLYPELVYGRCRTAPERIAAWWAMVRLARRVSVELRVHEIEYEPLNGPGRRHQAERAAVRRLLSQARTVSVHTSSEQSQLVAAVGVDPSSITVVDHGQHFVKHCQLDRAAARGELELDPDAHLFLSIGFLQAHKGFDRTMRAMVALGSVVDDHPAEAHVVGSMRIDHPDLRRHAEVLRTLAAASPRSFLHERYLSDAEFDVWLVACDTVVLPYREIWSSGVVERAKLYDRPVIASRIGGLAAQVGPSDTLVDDDAGLVAAMADRLGAVPPGREPEGSEIKERSELQAELEQLARPADVALIDPDSAIGAMAELGGLMPAVEVNSARRGVTQLKLLIQRLIYWQTQPILDRLNELQRATTEAVRRLDADHDEAP